MKKLLIILLAFSFVGYSQTMEKKIYMDYRKDDSLKKQDSIKVKQKPVTKKRN